MKLAKLGYSPKWVEFNILNESLFNEQMKELKNGESHNLEDFRYYTFVNWLESKEKLSDQEVNNYLLLAKEDADQLMAGTAIRTLFASAMLSDNQFELVKEKLAAYGSWTKKPIQYEILKRRLDKENLSIDLYKDCLTYKNEFSDNRLLVSIIERSDNEAILSDFANNGSGKRIRTLAEKKLKRIQRG